MNYCIITNDKALYEGDIVNFLIKGHTIDLAAEVVPGDTTVQGEIIKIDAKSQSLKIRFRELSLDIIDVPIHIWEGASIIKKEGPSDPNILFKYRGHNDGQ